MFQINDYVVYNATGVYKIIDMVREKDINDHDTDYYVLQPAYCDNLTIKTPINNRKVSMRKILTKEQVLALIASIPHTESVWISDDRQRTESFKAVLKRADCEEWVKLIRTIYLERQRKTEAGKKLTRSDEEIMRIAEKNVNEEFAVALDISPEEVESFILSRIPS